MAESDPTGELDRAVRKLLEQRRAHLEAIEQIDETFARYGVTPDEVDDAPPSPRAKKGGARGGAAGKKGRSAARGGAPRKGKKKASSKKRSSRGGGETSTDFILSLLKQRGPMTTSELAKAWKDAGRPGEVHQHLARLLRTGRIQRDKIEGGRTSQYSV